MEDGFLKPLLSSTEGNQQVSRHPAAPHLRADKLESKDDICFDPYKINVLKKLFASHRDYDINPKSNHTAVLEEMLLARFA